MRHPIITIYDLKHLTDMELEILDNALRGVLTSRDLTETERVSIIESLRNIVFQRYIRRAQWRDLADVLATNKSYHADSRRN